VLAVPILGASFSSRLSLRSSTYRRIANPFIDFTILLKVASLESFQEEADEIDDRASRTRTYNDEIKDERFCDEGETQSVRMSDFRNFCHVPHGHGHADPTKAGRDEIENWTDAPNFTRGNSAKWYSAGRGREEGRIPLLCLWGV